MPARTCASACVRIEVGGAPKRLIRLCRIVALQIGKAKLVMRLDQIRDRFECVAVFDRRFLEFSLRRVRVGRRQVIASGRTRVALAAGARGEQHEDDDNRVHPPRASQMAGTGAQCVYSDRCDSWEIPRQARQERRRKRHELGTGIVGAGHDRTDQAHQSAVRPSVARRVQHQPRLVGVLAGDDAAAAVIPIEHHLTIEALYDLVARDLDCRRTEIDALTARRHRQPARSRQAVLR